jgi:ribonucleoside-triphosphate reductase
VQNWNDGKSQEFKERKVYDVEKSTLKRQEKKFDQIVSQNSDVVSGNKILLFTTKTCPNCKISKLELDKAGISYEVIDAEDNKEVTSKYGIKNAPTMLVPVNGEYVRYSNASEIKGYIKNQKA